MEVWITSRVASKEIQASEGIISCFSLLIALIAFQKRNIKSTRTQDVSRTDGLDKLILLTLRTSCYVNYIS